MRRALLFAIIAGLLSSAIAQNPTSPQSVQAASMGKIGAADIWQMPPTFLADAHKACDNAPQPPSFAQCFIAQMSKAGAPAGAEAFTKLLYQKSDGDVGILSGFHPVGPVDVAWIVYPLRANTNGLLLVNGSPKIVNAEDLKLLDQKGMEQSFQFQDLQNQFPKVGVWPGDRDGASLARTPNRDPTAEFSSSWAIPSLTAATPAPMLELHCSPGTLTLRENFWERRSWD